MTKNAVDCMLYRPMDLNMPDLSPLYYHAIDLPDGFHPGVWDCRETTDVYLGHVAFAGKTVLEIGPANGYFTFEMERRGAQVNCLDLGPRGQWDLVPGPLIDHTRLECDLRVALSRIEAAFWKAHRALGSAAKMEYGSVYDAPRIVELHQIGIIGNVLQHLRDPFGGLMALADRVTETIIVTESLWFDDPRFETEAFMSLFPRAERPEVKKSWWQVSSPLIGEILKMLGFSRLTAEYHHPVFCSAEPPRPVKHVTWVGHR